MEIADYNQRMIIEIISLSILSIFLFFSWLPSSFAKAKYFGREWLLSNRDVAYPRPLPEWAVRSERAQQNLLYYFPSFAVGILICLQLGIGDTFTAMACMVFVVMRIFHYFAYMFGMPMFRAQAFIISLIAVVCIYIQIFVFLINGQSIGS